MPSTTRYECASTSRNSTELSLQFFVNFVQWSTIFTIFIFASIITLIAQAAASAIPPSIDPQHIVVLVLSGMFTLFTVVVFATQVHLILLNMTTVEHIGIQRMRDRERTLIAKMIRLPCSCSDRSDFGAIAPILPSNSPVKVLMSRRRILKQWDAEWGDINTEGNIWWLGSRRANWEATMGISKFGWIRELE